MLGSKQCDMGFCNNEITVTNINNPKKHKWICNDCEALVKDVTRAGGGGPSFTHYVSYMIYRAKSRGKYKVSITAQDILSIWPKDNCCPILQESFKSGEPRWNSPSIDRIDPTRGYEVDNVMIISTLANRMKNDATEKQLKRFVEYFHSVLR